jgi:hypothetical protein
MSAILSLILLICGSMGLGAAAMWVIGIWPELQTRERLPWAFAIGYGLLGWLLFFFGVSGFFQPVPLVLLLGLGCLGLLVFRVHSVPVVEIVTPNQKSLIDLALFAALILVLMLDLMEGLSPPADGDSMAYHFALAKYFISENRLVFIERALDGAVPLINQMTYIPALMLGGERGLTLWAMVSGWGAAGLLFSICRRHLDQRWSLALSIVFLSVPAVVYGGGSGQVEVRNAMFATIAAISVAYAVTRDDLRYAVLAGLGVGFFMAGKYIGLLFALACGLAILMQRRWFVHGFVLTVIALVAGSQWYIWNFIHTGDPVFPMLFGTLDYRDVAFWNAEQHATLQTLLAVGERAVPTNLKWLILYPFVSTISGLRQFESSRTGLGPYLLLMLPFAAASAWQFRNRMKRHPLLVVAIIAVLFYALWFLIGSSQRVRHIVPILPIALLVVTVAAHRWGRERGILKPILAVVFVTLSIQLAGHSVFGLNYARHLVSGESREAFLMRNVHSYGVVPWINKNLGSGIRLYLTSRQLNYFLDVPYFYGHAQQEGRVDTRSEADNPLRFLSQIQDRGVTHLMVGENPSSVSLTNGKHQWRPLLRAGCLERIATIETQSIGSRTLNQSSAGQAYILKIVNSTCVP